LGLKEAINAQSKRKKKRTTIDMPNDDTWHGGAVFYSPRKVEESRRREAAKQDEAELEKLQKTHDRELKAAATLYKKKQAEAAKERRKKEREEATISKKARDKELAARRRVKSNNKTLQLHKKLAIQQVRPPEQPHKAPLKKEHVVVVLWVVEVVLRLHQPRRLHH
jgi:hypothetical protein